MTLHCSIIHVIFFVSNFPKLPWKFVHIPRRTNDHCCPDRRINVSALLCTADPLWDVVHCPRVSRCPRVVDDVCFSHEESPYPDNAITREWDVHSQSVLVHRLRNILILSSSEVSTSSTGTPHDLTYLRFTIIRRLIIFYLSVLSFFTDCDSICICCE